MNKEEKENMEKKFIQTLDKVSDCICDMRIQTEQHLGFKLDDDILGEIKETHNLLNEAEEYLRLIMRK